MVLGADTYLLLINLLRVYQKQVTRLAISPDKKVLAVAGHNTVK